MKKPSTTRREFLQLASAFSLAPLARLLPDYRKPPSEAALPNLIIILYDALSVFNLSLYGYPRKTSPNLERLASRATVYHNHRSAGNFTTPSTASLFTSTYPWKHRALSLNGLIKPDLLAANLFNRLEGAYQRVGYAQNIYVDTLLYQLDEWLERHERLDRFCLSGNIYYNRLFENDAIAAQKSIDQFLFKREEAHGSLFLSLANDLSSLLGARRAASRLVDVYPDGPPRLANTDITFSLEQVTGGTISLLGELSSPYMAYIHFMPPHEPYTPTRQFLGTFKDGWSPPEKKRHPLAPRVSQDRLNERRQTYDEFIANLDEEFGRILDHLEQTGLLDTSYVIFTSDHGELFERGAHGHSTPLLFEPVVRIPLVISAPGQRQRNDIYTNTSNIDLFPTLLNIAGREVPEACSGRTLPGLTGHAEEAERSTFVVEAKQNPAYQQLRKASLALIRGRYKLVHYLGYVHYDDKYELYDLENDPDELENLYPSHPMAQELKEELDRQRQEADQPYRKV